MKSGILLVSALIFLYSCKEEVTEPYKKQVKEISHFADSRYSWDSSWVQGKKKLDFLLALEAVPNHYVLQHVESDSFVEAHVYPDLYLLIRQGKDSLIFNKDSLLPFVNQEYLDEALIGDVQLMAFEPGLPFYLIEFELKKPKEDFAFHFQVMIEQKSFKLNIVDE